MSKDSKGADKDAKGKKRNNERTLAEWVLFGLASVIILGISAVLVLSWYLGPSDPPTFDTRVEPARFIDGAYQVPVTVENVGNEAAAGVRVSAELKIDGETVSVDQNIQFLAADEEKEIAFVFDRDPREGELSVIVDAYQEP